MLGSASLDEKGFLVLRNLLNRCFNVLPCNFTLPVVLYLTVRANQDNGGNAMHLVQVRDYEVHVRERGELPLVLKKPYFVPIRLVEGDTPYDESGLVIIADGFDHRHFADAGAA